MGAIFLSVLQMLLLVGILLSMLISSSVTYASTLDSAINHYLNGFRFCQQARSLYYEKNYTSARNKMKDYRVYFDEAKVMNGSIVETENRGMKGNITFCQRVMTDVDVALAMPIMALATEQCEMANVALMDNDINEANKHLQRFEEARNDALTITDKLSNVLSVNNQVKRCFRVKEKVLAAQRKRIRIENAMQEARDESFHYVQRCFEAFELLTKEVMMLSDFQQALESALIARFHKKNVKDEVASLDVLLPESDYEAIKLMEKKMAEGDQCLRNVDKIIARSRKLQQFLRNRGDSFLLGDFSGALANGNNKLPNQ